MVHYKEAASLQPIDEFILKSGVVSGGETDTGMFANETSVARVGGVVVGWTLLIGLMSLGYCGWCDRCIMKLEQKGWIPEGPGCTAPVHDTAPNNDIFVYGMGLW